MGKKRIKSGSWKRVNYTPFQMTCLMHFEDLRNKGDKDLGQAILDLSCFRCEDFKHGVCAGEFRFGYACLSCMEEKVRAGEVVGSF